MPRINNKKKRSPASTTVTGRNKKAEAKTTKPSPDSVACIDLTSNDGEYFVVDPEKERRLGSVRKKLKPSPRKDKRGGLKTTGLEDSGCEEVIFIDSDEDSTSNFYEDDDCEIIDVDNATAAVAPRPTKKARMKKEDDFSLSSRKKQVEDVDDDEMDNEGVEIIQATAPRLAAATMVPELAAGSAINTSGDEDVVVEGVINETRLPHMRQHCTRFPFTRPDRSGNIFASVRDANSQSCDLCYCYVCDCPVKDCQHWLSSLSALSENNHCCASDKDVCWERMRSRTKMRKSRATKTGLDDDNDDNSSSGRTGDDPPSGYHFTKDCFQQHYIDEPCDHCWCYVCDTSAIDGCCEYYNHIHACPTIESYREERRRRKLPTFGKQGPFNPDNQDAHLDKDLTKCRHCSWYVRLEVCRSIPSSRDWCAHCGRVASEKDLEKEQINLTNDKANQIEGSVFVGQKEIPFRIKAHDPRLFAKYKENWEDDGFGSSGWRYDDREREEEVFLHRLGRSPNFSNIADSIPHVVNENIPKTFEAPSMSSSRIDDWKIQDATDAVIIEDPEQLQFVYLIALMGKAASVGKSLKTLIEVNASWDKQSRSGVFKFRLNLPKNVFLGQTNHSSYAGVSEYIPVILGLWFDIFPLQPSELCGLLDASSSKDIVNDLIGNITYRRSWNIPIKPYRVEPTTNVINDIRDKLSSRLDALLSSNYINESRLTMTSSDGSRFSGGVCLPPSTDSFRDSIVRYFSEQFVTLVGRSQRHEDLIASCIGTIRSDSFTILDAILGFQTAVTAEAIFGKDAWKCLNITHPSSIENTMIRVESLGHESEDCVQGLKVELLDFQRESLKWALEREQTPGGVQSYYWPKLPSRCEEQEDIYFNPMFKLFRKDKPAVVRGGFIAEQMGLGKTIISLALILKNPAPGFPLSGSRISAIEKKDPYNGASESCGWEKNLYQKTSIRNKKIGSIICKGTLVICPVSLVGQWIDEARNKLKEPGLIYPYHGQNRERDPTKLAANSIVVTTYDILASDAFHHAKKAGSYYCPPLEQIRWWRIICDEGHSLRESKTRRSKAVLSLVADHKWIVSGTPMNTSHRDLKNQLKFLGFEHVEKIMNGPKGKGEVDKDLLMYLLRPIMMRHSQGQKYRGTSTTLMSLPPKTERKQLVRFTASEKKEFEKIEREAQDWYIKFRSANPNKISKHFLKISSKLTPLRIACSGGKYPISSGKFNGEDDVKEGTAVDSDESREEKKTAKNHSTRVPIYSKFIFKSKFKSLLSQLKNIRDKEPDSKSLVFSQFTSTLDWLKVELPKHGFQFRTLSGDMSMKKRSKALAEFQNDPPTTIFLLSMRAGAVGINLTQANRVFLMEPSFNPALEAQAIGRIHRLGQKRPVEIVRLVVKNSVEERMVNFLEQKYGKYSEKRPEAVSKNDQKNDASDKNIIAADDSKNYARIAGNLKSDKAQLVTAEFDTLFGVEAMG